MQTARAGWLADVEGEGEDSFPTGDPMRRAWLIAAGTRPNENRYEVILYYVDSARFTMTLTVRLDPSLESSFTRVCKRRGTTKSAVITEAVREFVQRDLAHEPSFADLAADLFGADTSPLPRGVTDVSGNVKALLKQKLRAKHSR